ncbi:MAG: carbohydrate binding domain-containing protein [Spirochaetales bacterium]|nr:carbohydrate binding domain-containing protein [Spirochaetales bacterium]
MKKISICLVLLSIVVIMTSCLSEGKANTAEEPLIVQGPIVILKLDDLRDNSVDKFTPVANYILENNLKASFGINGKYLEGKTEDDLFVVSSKYWDSTGNIEIWHHGWDHSKASDRSWYEYKGRDKDERTEYADLTTNSNYERQLRDFQKNQEIVKEVLGITMHTFGSPYNQNDETFTEVINQFPEMKVVFFPRTPLTKQIGLSITTDAGRLNIENGGTGKADYDYFLANYESYDKTMDYMVLQAHPGYFNEEGLEAFKQICAYLVAQGHTFMTPYEYFMYKTGGEMPEPKEVLTPPPVEELVLGTTNILVNGDFAGSDSSPWSVYNAESADSELSIVDGEAYMNILNPGANAWDVQLKQGEIQLEQGKRYRVVFTARAEGEERTIESNVIDDLNTKLSYSNKETFTITKDAKEFYYDFSMYEATTQTGRLRFRLGKLEGNVFIDNVALYEYVPK